MTGVQASRPRVRRYPIRFFVIPVGLVAAFIVFIVHLIGNTQTVSCDFRDTGCLARAVEQGAQRHGDGTPYFADCVQLAFPNYFCAIDFYGGVTANYNVTVADDGSSWVAS